jgi:hypothetical protein
MAEASEEGQGTHRAVEPMMMIMMVVVVVVVMMIMMMTNILHSRLMNNNGDIFNMIKCSKCVIQ